jgi:hypothetical protein
MKNYFLASLFFLLTSCAYSQWNPNTFLNLAVSSLNGDDLQTATTSDGKTWIAFYSNNGGNYDMRAQLLDVNGNKLLGPDGMLVSNQTSGSATFVFNVCIDGNNSLIIGYQYEVAGVLSAVVSKVNTDGTLPWVNGVVLGEGLAPYPAINKTNDVVVCWNNNSPSTLRVQKVSNAGITMWASPISINVGTSNTTRGQIVCHPNSDFTTVFQKKSFGISTTLYAQRYNTSGVALWTSPVQLSNQTTSAARYYSILTIGNTTYYGYYSSVGFRFNSFLQKIKDDGTLPWGINGSAFSTYNGASDPYQQTTSIAHANSSPFIWSACTYSNSAQSQYGVFVQKFDTAAGTVLLNPIGKEIFPISASFESLAGSLSLFNDAPFFAVYDVDYKIYATRLDANGDFVWPGNRVELSSTTAGPGSPKGRFAFTTCVNNQSVTVWSENRGVEKIVYAQAITAFGVLPVAMKNFTATKKSNNCELNWTTTAEINCTSFEIERAVEGVLFTKIGKVNSKSVNGNSNTSLQYSFQDNKPLIGNNYYRLKQLDVDGNYKYSNVDMIMFNETSALSIQSVFPNPALEFTQINLFSKYSGKCNIFLFDEAGRKINRFAKQLINGNNSININTTSLSKGIYIINITTDNGLSVSTKLIVNHSK